MRATTALIAAALLSGCLDEDPDPAAAVLPDEPSAATQDTLQLEDELSAAGEALDAAVSRLAGLETRLAEAEAAVAANTWDVGNAELWLESLTADMLAMEEHASTQDGILVSTAARIDEAEAAAAEHMLTADAAFGSQNVRLDDLEAEAASQAVTVSDMKTDATAMQADLVAAAAAIGVVDAAIAVVDAAVNDVSATVYGLPGEMAAVVDYMTEVSTETEERLGEVEDQLAELEDLSGQLGSMEDQTASLDALDQRVEAVEDRIILLAEFDVDATQTCTFGSTYQGAVYSLAVDISPEQMLFLQASDQSLEPVILPEVACGSTEIEAFDAAPLGLASGGQVYVLNATEVASLRGTGVPTWRVLSQE